MDGAKFAKMLSDKHLFELDRMEYKYSVSSVKEFIGLLRQNLAQPLPLADFRKPASTIIASCNVASRRPETMSW